MAKDGQDPFNRRPFFLRVDDDLRHQLANKARESERSLNGEIIFRLRQSLRTADEAASSTTIT